MQWVTDDLAAYDALLIAASTLNEKRWVYNDFDPATFSLTPTNIHDYLNHSITHAHGKLVQTISYDLNGDPINFKFLSKIFKFLPKMDDDVIYFPGSECYMPYDPAEFEFNIVEIEKMR